MLRKMIAAAHRQVDEATDEPKEQSLDRKDGPHGSTLRSGRQAASGQESTERAFSKAIPTKRNWQQRQRIHGRNNDGSVANWRVDSDGAHVARLAQHHNNPK